jgi:hypothetical protein
VAKWNILPKVNSVHPIFTYISMEKREMSLKGPYARAVCSYAGIENSVSDFTAPFYELIIGLSEEPIETHPNFVSKIGWTAMAPKNGAVFRHVNTGQRVTQYAKASNNDGYVFDSFLVFVDGKLNEFAKVESYLEASQVTWRKTYNGVAHPSNLVEAGKIGNPDGPAPSLPSGRNWLDMGITATKRGSAVQLVHEWRASGRRGWIQSVYGS